MRLLYITRETFPTFRPDVTDLFGSHLPRFGVESTLVAMAEPEAIRDGASWRGGRTLLASLPRNRAARVVAGLLHDLACVAKHARKHRAVVVRDKILTAALALILARLLGRPLFYWMSFPFPDDDLMRARRYKKALGPLRRAYTLGRGLATRRLLYCWILPRCAHAFVQSDRMREDLAGLGIPAEKLTAVPMGVDLERLDAAHASPGPRTAGPGRLVYVGALDAARRPGFLVEVLTRVREVQPDTTMLLVGNACEQADRRQLEEQIQAAGMEDAIKITGWLSQETAWREAARCDVGLCPLPPDPVMLSMSSTKSVELMALGLPLVVSDHPDQTHLVREGGAGVSVPYDPEAFAKASAGLLSDPERAAALGSNGRDFVERQRSYPVLARNLARRLGELLPPGAPNRQPGVLLVSPALDVKGGISRVVHGYLNSELAKEYRLGSVASHRDGSRPYKLLIAAAGLLHAAYRLAAGKVEIVHLHAGDFPSPQRKYLFYLLARLFGKKTVFHPHGGGMPEQIAGGTRFWRNRLTRMLERVDRVVCQSSWYAAQVRKLAPGARITVLPNGVDLPNPKQGNREEPRGTVRFTLLGRDVRRKGLFDLLPAMAQAISEGADAFLHVAGCDPSPELEAAAAGQGLAGRIRYWGWVDGPDRERLWAETDVLVLPTHRESLPLSLLEAMARGLPVLTTPVAGIPEMVEHGRNGLLVAPGDIAGLAAAIHALAGDSEFRRALGLEARRIVAERFSLERVAGMLGDLYAEMLAPDEAADRGRKAKS